MAATASSEGHPDFKRQGVSLYWIGAALTFNVFGHVIVDNHRHILDVNTTTCHICSHQNILGPSLEVGQCKLSLLLAFSTMQCTRIVLLEECGDKEKAMGSWEDIEVKTDRDREGGFQRAAGQKGKEAGERSVTENKQKPGELQAELGDNGVVWQEEAG